MNDSPFLTAPAAGSVVEGTLDVVFTIPASAVSIFLNTVTLSFVNQQGGARHNVGLTINSTGTSTYHFASPTKPPTSLVRGTTYNVFVSFQDVTGTAKTSPQNNYAFTLGMCVCLFVVFFVLILC